MPAAVGSLQLDPETDWMYTADPGNAGLGLVGNLMPVPRGKMLGGSSGINYMAYVRGHPGDFDAWAEAGAIAAMVAAGETELADILVIADSPTPVPPCGGCRQKIAEFAGAGVTVTMCTLSGETRDVTVADLLPGAFSGAHMEG